MRILKVLLASLATLGVARKSARGLYRSALFRRSPAAEARSAR